MAFGDTIMTRFSDEAIELDPAYESLFDTDTDEFTEFMKIACENCDPYDPDCDCDDDDDDIDFDDDEDDDDEYDEFDDDDTEESCCKEGKCCTENAITDATPQQKRERYFKMLDANSRFSPEKKKEMKENYDKAHPEGLAAVKESAADYLRAMKMLGRSDESLNEDVSTAYDEDVYEDDYLSNHANFAANLKTGYKRLVEKNVTILNNFIGDNTAKYSANLHTSYARESADYLEAEMMYDDVYKEVNGGHFYNEDELSAYDKMALEAMEGTDTDMDEGLDNCRSALEDMLNDLNNV